MPMPAPHAAPSPPVPSARAPSPARRRAAPSPAAWTLPPQPVVVITGASRGLGYATALAFARQGARLVLGARSADTLATAALACRAAGGTALGVPTDVTEARAVQALATAAIAHFGRIDVWINAAGASALGRFDRTPLAAHRRVIDTALCGALHGAYTVLPHFRARGQGVFIQPVGLNAWVPRPDATAANAAQAGLRGLCSSLRADMAPWPGVQVCEVLTSAIDTPGWRLQANYTGRRVRPAGPLLDAHRVAQVLLAVARRPRAHTRVGWPVWPARWGQALLPATWQRGWRWAQALLRRRAPAAPGTAGHLFAPAQGLPEADGGLRSQARERRAQAALWGVAALGLAWWATRRWQRRP